MYYETENMDGIGMGIGDWAPTTYVFDPAQCRRREPQLTLEETIIKLKNRKEGKPKKKRR